MQILQILFPLEFTTGYEILLRNIGRIAMEKRKSLLKSRKFAFFPLRNLQMHNFLCCTSLSLLPNFISSTKAFKKQLAGKLLRMDFPFFFFLVTINMKRKWLWWLQFVVARIFLLKRMRIMQTRTLSEKRRKKLENNPIYSNLQFTDVMASASNC